MFLLKKLNVAEDNYCLTSEFFIGFTIVFFFVLEVVNGIYFFNNPDQILSLSFYPKIVWQFILLIFIGVSFRKLNRRELWFFLFSLIIVIIALIRFQSSVVGIKHFDKLLLFFFSYIFLRLYNPRLSTMLRLFDIILISNSLLIFVGFLLGIEFFKSYPFSSRFGYSGVFCRYSINDVSFFYLIAIFYSIYRWKRGEIKLWFFIIIFFSSFLVGTKAIYLQNFILLGYVFVAERRSRIMIISITVSAIIILLITYNFSFWNDLLKEKGILAVLTSTRSELLLEKYPLMIQDLSVFNILLGYKNPFPYFVEMDVIDLFLTIGIIGGSTIFYFYRSILFQFERNNYFAWTFIGAFILMVCISGRYSYSGMNAFYFPFFLYYLKQNE